MKKQERNGDEKMVLEDVINQVNTERVLLSKLTFLMREQANITDSFLLWTVEYCTRHNIPIFEESRFKNLVSDSKFIIKEIKQTSDNLEKVCKKPFLLDKLPEGGGK